MKKSIRRIMIAALAVMTVVCFTACGGSGSPDSSSSDQAASTSSEAEALADLSGQSLMVYCGAGMKDPFTKITDNFKEETGCDVQLTFGNGAQIQSQIKTTEQGDLFIAGAATELKALQEADMVTDTKDLVKHIPVIAVPEENPAKVESIADLANAKLVLGDAESTPIGKIADAVLADAGLTDSADILARTSTAPEMITALTTGEADAAIVWKENASGKDGIKIVDTDEMDPYIKTIPAASLSCSENAEALGEFLDYLDTDAAHKVWESAGYVIAE